MLIAPRYREAIDSLQSRNDASLPTVCEGRLVQFWICTFIKTPTDASETPGVSCLGSHMFVNLDDQLQAPDGQNCHLRLTANMTRSLQMLQFCALHTPRRPEVLKSLVRASNLTIMLSMTMHMHVTCMLPIVLSSQTCVWSLVHVAPQDANRCRMPSLTDTRYSYDNSDRQAQTSASKHTLRWHSLTCSMLRRRCQMS